MKAWFDMARRVLNLTVQLDARAAELRDAHRQVAYWKDLAGQRWEDIQRLNVALADAQPAKQVGMGDISPAVVAVPLGSRDRENANRLALENADLRAEVERLKNGRNPS